jgi:hypothetical protein
MVEYFEFLLEAAFRLSDGRLEVIKYRRGTVG